LLRLHLSHLAIIVLTLNKFLWLKFEVFTGSPIHPPSRCSQSVAYKLDLPASSHIHLVFHVSLLKKALGPQEQVSSELPLFSDALQYPESVLQHRMLHRKGTQVPQLLIKWSSKPADLAT
jgi:hypothetical protein